MTRTFTNFLLAGAFACSVSAQPVVTMVVNRTSYSGIVSPGSWVIILGCNFASSPQSAPAGIFARSSRKAREVGIIVPHYPHIARGRSNLPAGCDRVLHRFRGPF